MIHLKQLRVLGILGVLHHSSDILMAIVMLSNVPAIGQHQRDFIDFRDLIVRNLKNIIREISEICHQKNLKSCVCIQTLKKLFSVCHLFKLEWVELRVAILNSVNILKSHCECLIGARKFSKLSRHHKVSLKTKLLVLLVFIHGL